MYNIKEAAARSGVSIATLRAWERRYGVVAPERTPSGYRLYDDAAIQRLRQMRRLLDSGWRAREAAQEVLAGRAVVEEAPPDARRDAQPARRLIEALVDAVRPMDSAAFTAALDETFASGTFEWAMEQIVFPALREVGRRWETGEIDVAAEHAASHHVVRRLAMLFDAAARPGRRPDAVVGLPPGARHDLGALAFGVAARRLGIGVLYLGADVPARSWLAALVETKAPLSVMAVPMRSDAATAASVIEAISADDTDVRWLVGGPGVDALPPDLEAIRLEDGIDDAARAVRRVLDGSRRAVSPESAGLTMGAREPVTRTE